MIRMATVGSVYTTERYIKVWVYTLQWWKIIWIERNDMTKEETICFLFGNILVIFGFGLLSSVLLFDISLDFGYLSVVLIPLGFVFMLFSRMWTMKRCPTCDTILVNLYCRDGAGGKYWVKVKPKYCKHCKEVVK